MKTQVQSPQFNVLHLIARWWGGVASAVVVGLLASGGAASGQTVPALMNYQGKLVDGAGNPMANGSYDVVFKVWKKGSPADPADALVWGQTNTVTLVNGIFNVVLGGPGGLITSASKTNLVDAFEEANRYLSLTIVRNPAGPVPAPAEMLPRAQMLSAPYALKSAVANDAVSAFNGVPPGSILPFGGTNVPSEFLLCDGTTVSRTTYARLYAAIGSAWGAGDGYNTFNLPDLRGYFLRGVDTLGGTDPDRAARTNRSGQIVGSVVGSLQADSFKSHNHSTGVRQENHAGGGWQSLANPTTINVQLPSSFTGGAETRPKYAYVNYIIKY